MSTLIINRTRAVAGAPLAFSVYVNGKKIGKIKNGETKTFTIDAIPTEVMLKWSFPLGNTHSKPLEIGSVSEQRAIKIGCVAKNKVFINTIDLWRDS